MISHRDSVQPASAGAPAPNGARLARGAAPAGGGGYALAGRYYRNMLSLSPIHLVLVTLFLTIVGELRELPYALGLNIGLLIVLNYLGARVLFAPVDRYLCCGGSASEAARRIRHLPALSAAWIAVIVLILTTTGLLGFNVLCPSCDFRALLPFRLTMMTLFTSFCAIYAYFAIEDLGGEIRTRLFQDSGVTISPVGGLLSRKLLLAFIAVTVIPGTLVFFDAFFFETARNLQGITMAQAFRFDLVMTVVTGVAVLIFIPRGLLRQVRYLIDATRRIRHGDLEARAPVASDDELGELTLRFNAMADGLKEREFLREAFGKYVPRPVAAEILADRGLLEPQTATATILFTDIAGFTAITERLGSHRLVAALNEYFSLLVEVIERHRGVVTQFQGDAMLVVYNVPVEDPMHAIEAVTTALEIQACLQGRRFAGDVRFETRIGINTGTVLAGAVGAADRLNYTVHGDTVNLAARLQELNKNYRTHILVADATRRLAGEGFAFRRVDEAAIRGHAAPVEVYTVESGGDG